MTHLILHKVRGQPAFDVAEQLENGWWVIPTSGHRCYPFETWQLNRIIGDIVERVPDNWPDHYSINDSQRDGGSEQPRSVPAARKATVTPLPTLDDLD